MLIWIFSVHSVIFSPFFQVNIQFDKSTKIALHIRSFIIGEKAISESLFSQNKTTFTWRQRKQGDQVFSKEASAPDCPNKAKYIIFAFIKLTLN